MRAVGLAVGDRVQRLQRRRDLAGGGNGDGELAVGHVRQRVGEGLPAAEKQVEARLKRGRHLPAHLRARIGDGGTRDGEARRGPKPHDKSSSSNPHVRRPFEPKKAGRRSLGR